MALGAIKAHPLVHGLRDLGLMEVSGDLGPSASDNRQAYVAIWKRTPPG